MILELGTVQHLSELISDARENTTGYRLESPNTSTWPTDGDTSASFTRLVSAMYIWFHETWGDEVRYFLEVASRFPIATGSVRQFEGLVIDLRTSQQHASNSDCLRRSKKWYRDVAGTDSPVSPDEWDLCSSGLVGSCKGALSNLVTIVRAMSADDAIGVEWSTRTAASRLKSTEEQFSIVVADIGVPVTPGQQTHLQRLIGHDWSRRLIALTERDDIGAELANTVERVVIRWALSSLPCNYWEVLDVTNAHLGNEAIGALELAHAIVDLVEFDSADEFLDHVKRIWSALEARPSSM